MGTGTTGLICKKLERHFMGIELDEDYFNLSKERIKNLDKVSQK
jgi:site-specific DNA-methyltransferase (adenine-specific)